MRDQVSVGRSRFAAHRFSSSVRLRRGRNPARRSGPAVQHGADTQWNWRCSGIGCAVAPMRRQGEAVAHEQKKRASCAACITSRYSISDRASAYTTPQRPARISPGTASTALGPAVINAGAVQQTMNFTSGPSRYGGSSLGSRRLSLGIAFPRPAARSPADNAHRQAIAQHP